MELEKIKELIEMMEANDLSELEIVDGQSRIMLKRGQYAPTPATPAVPPAAGQVASHAAPPVIATESSSVGGAVRDEGLLEIKSPIVGTFYIASSPTAEPFVAPGDAVSVDGVVCIIEAMKVMNEVKSEVSGTIKKILCENGQAVEFGQPLFLVEP